MQRSRRHRRPRRDKGRAGFLSLGRSLGLHPVWPQYRHVRTPFLRRLTADLRDVVGRDAPVLIDQEGFASSACAPRIGPTGPRRWTKRRSVIARSGCIITCWRKNCATWALMQIAPRFWISRATTRILFLRNRCLGSDPDTARPGWAALLLAMLAAGVLPIVKHMPGHGRARVDSHKDLPVVDAPAVELRWPPISRLSARWPTCRWR